MGLIETLGAVATVAGILGSFISFLLSNEHRLTALEASNVEIKKFLGIG